MVGSHLTPRRRGVALKLMDGFVGHELARP
jgi:hypothetical protein